MKINYPKIQSEISEIRAELVNQDFQIDVAYSIYKKLLANTEIRNDLNRSVISAYWGRELFNHFLMNNYPIDITGVLYKFDYASYLDLIEIVETNARSGNVTNIIDLVTDSTDVKIGMDIDEWVDDNEVFVDNIQSVWSEEVLPVWQDEGKLVTRKKKNINLSEYWKSENYLYLLRVYDYELDLFAIFIVGKYTDYVKD